VKLMVEIHIGENGVADLGAAAVLLEAFADDLRRNTPDPEALKTALPITTVEDTRTVGSWLVAELSPNEVMLDDFLTRWDSDYGGKHCTSVVRPGANPRLTCGHFGSEHDPLGACLVNGCGCAKFEDNDKSDA
jgi:hypothetical protein